MNTMDEHVSELRYIARRSGFSEVDLDLSDGLDRILFRATDRFGKECFFTLSLHIPPHMSGEYTDERKVDLLMGCIESLSCVNWTDDPLTSLADGLNRVRLSICSVSQGTALCLIVDCRDVFSIQDPICSIVVWDVKDKLAISKRRMEAEFELLLLEAGYDSVHFSDDGGGKALSIAVNERGGVQLIITCSVADERYAPLSMLGRFVALPHLKDATRAVLEALIDMDWDDPVMTLTSSLTSRAEDYVPVVKYGVSTYSFRFRLNGCFEGSIKLNQKAYTIVEERVALTEERRRRELKAATALEQRNALQILRLRDGEAVVDFDSMDGHEFESFCAKLLELNGYERVAVTRGSGDQGIDILAERDGVRFGFQCKRYSGEVGNAAVREVFAGKAFYGCHVAIVISNSSFTRAAHEAADGLGVILWDRIKLEELIHSADAGSDGIAPGDEEGASA